jgi:nucleotide-binding universal stress UspA family protein
MGRQMKRILVATDGSESSDRAVDYAAQQARITGAGLLIVHIVGGYGLPEDIFQRFTHAQHAWLQELLESLSAQVLTKARDRAKSRGDVEVLLESREGDVAQTIVDIAKEKEADVIVVGKRGEGRITGLLLGSVSQKLVSLSPRPVTVVP